jgi:hypothetical protein
MKQIIAVSAFILMHHLSSGQCANSSNIYEFAFNGHTYQVVKENKSWADAAICAVARGGHLLEINSAAEQAAVNLELANNTGINASNSKAPDGGNASYVWTAGNDRGTEGKWVWENSGTQFWSGVVAGSNVGGAYTNWGSVRMREPDNFLNEQHALGLAITNWPNGLRGEWNDIKESNMLYYIIELDRTLGMNEITDDVQWVIYPNPTSRFVYIQSDLTGQSVKEASVYDVLGRMVLSTINHSGIRQIDLSGLHAGNYMISLSTSNDKQVRKRIVLAP